MECLLLYVRSKNCSQPNVENTKIFHISYCESSPMYYNPSVFSQCFQGSKVSPMKTRNSGTLEILTE